MTELDADGRPLRRDAAANRARIVTAAAELFAERGIEVGYDEIARRAGVGVGTVYRRFPERSELVLALFRGRIDDIAVVVQESLEEADPWQGLLHFFEQSVRMQLTDQGLKQVLFASGASLAPLVEARERLTEPIHELLDRAKQAGVLRADFEGEDLGVITSFLSSLSLPAVPELWRRYLQIVLDGLRPSRDEPTALPVRALTTDEVTDVMQRAAGH